MPPEIEEDGMLRLGIDLGGTKIEIVAFDEAGRECLRRRAPTPSGDYRATLDTVAALVEGAENALRARGTVGFGMPGA
jgi:fructokinase